MYFGLTILAIGTILFGLAAPETVKSYKNQDEYARTQGQMATTEEMLSLVKTHLQYTFVEINDKKEFRPIWRKTAPLLSIIVKTFADKSKLGSIVGSLPYFNGYLPPQNYNTGKEYTREISDGFSRNVPVSIDPDADYVEKLINHRWSFFRFEWDYKNLTRPSLRRFIFFCYILGFFLLAIPGGKLFCDVIVTLGSQLK